MVTRLSRGEGAVQCGTGQPDGEVSMQRWANLMTWFWMEEMLGLFARGPLLLPHDRPFELQIGTGRGVGRVREREELILSGNHIFD